MSTCYKCNGVGFVQQNGKPPQTCHVCGGFGRLENNPYREHRTNVRPSKLRSTLTIIGISLMFVMIVIGSNALLNYWIG